MRNGTAGSIPDDVIRILMTLILQSSLWPVVDRASIRNEYKEYFMGVKFAGM
jgi:hypothetical protein